MSVYDELDLYPSLEEDMDRLNRLEFGSEEWKRAADSIDKRYNTVVNEAKIGMEMDERQSRLNLEYFKAEKDAELRNKEAEIADRKSKRELIGKVLGVIGGIGIVVGKIVYDNSESITDTFTLNAGSKMTSGK